MSLSSSTVKLGQRPSPVMLTDAAVAKVTALLAQEGDDSLALRVAVRPGGCSGYSYEMFFDSELADNDIVRTFGSVRGRRGPRERGAHQGCNARVPRRPARSRLSHHQPERDTNLRLRLVLQLSRTPSKWQAPSDVHDRRPRPVRRRPMVGLLGPARAG